MEKFCEKVFTSKNQKEKKKVPLHLWCSPPLPPGQGARHSWGQAPGELAVAARCRAAPPSPSHAAPRESPLCGLEIVYDDGAEAMDNALIGMIGEGIDELLEVVAHEDV